MTDTSITTLMAMETAHAEQTRDELIEEPGVRKNQVRSRLIAVRFAPDEATELERQAREAGTSVSALIRGRALRGEGPWTHVSAAIIDAISPLVQPRSHGDAA